MAPQYFIEIKFDKIIWFIADSQGKKLAVKTMLTKNEEEIFGAASKIIFPVDIDNVTIPKLVSNNPEGLPPIIVKDVGTNGLLIMERGEGEGVITWNSPIAHGDWNNLRKAIKHMNAEGVYHGDLYSNESILLRKASDGRTHFAIIDWGGQKLKNLEKKDRMNDEQHLDRLEGDLVERALLPKKVGQTKINGTWTANAEVSDNTNYVESALNTKKSTAGTPGGDL